MKTKLKTAAFSAPEDDVKAVTPIIYWSHVKPYEDQDAGSITIGLGWWHFAIHIQVIYLVNNE